MEWLVIVVVCDSCQGLQSVDRIAVLDILDCCKCVNEKLARSVRKDFDVSASWPSGRKIGS
jgi:hypothetical protein